jgi:hypothetical protein
MTDATPRYSDAPPGSNFSLSSETNKYTHAFLASPVTQSGPARGDTEIEKDFDMSVVLIPVEDALSGSGSPSPAWIASAP